MIAIIHLSDRVNKILISQLINGISRVLQKYLNDLMVQLFEHLLFHYFPFDLLLFVYM